MDFARLNHSTVSFFDEPKPETAASRWNRVNLNASKVPPIACYLRKHAEKYIVYCVFYIRKRFCVSFYAHFAYLQQVGKGLSRDGKALKLAFQHWIEAVSTNPTRVLFVSSVVLFALDLVAVLSCVKKYATLSSS
jgi:hypothetical protein